MRLYRDDIKPMPARPHPVEDAPIVRVDGTRWVLGLGSIKMRSPKTRAAWCEWCGCSTWAIGAWTNVCCRECLVLTGSGLPVGFADAAIIQRHLLLVSLRPPIVHVQVGERTLPRPRWYTLTTSRRAAAEILLALPREMTRCSLAEFEPLGRHWRRWARG